MPSGNSWNRFILELFGVFATSSHLARKRGSQIGSPKLRGEFSKARRAALFAVRVFGTFAGLWFESAERRRRRTTMANDAAPYPDSRRVICGRLRVAGVIVLVLGIVGAITLYKVRTRSSDVMDDPMLANYSR